jgi:abortive infection bacteriophage resistance protein
VLPRKPAKTWDEQVQLLVARGLDVPDADACREFLVAENYYRFAGYARYFQKAPHYGDDNFPPGTTFDQIRAIYYADQALRDALASQLTRAELLLRSHTARAVVDAVGPYERYLEQNFYLDATTAEPTVEPCLRDIKRSKERHILRFGGDEHDLKRELPVWSAVEAWSFGTLSKCIERGDNGALVSRIANSLGVAHAGLASRVRALVYLRNRCAHHSRLWHHSVIDAGPTPNNVRTKAKKLAGNFDPRSILDVVASLDDLVFRASGLSPVLPVLIEAHRVHTSFWDGLRMPVSPKDHRR